MLEEFYRPWLEVVRIHVCVYGTNSFQMRMKKSLHNNNNNIFHRTSPSYHYCLITGLGSCVKLLVSCLLLIMMTMEEEEEDGFNS